MSPGGVVDGTLFENVVCLTIQLICLHLDEDRFSSHSASRRKLKTSQENNGNKRRITDDESTGGHWGQRATCSCD